MLKSEAEPAVTTVRFRQRKSFICSSFGMYCAFRLSKRFVKGFLDGEGVGGGGSLKEVDGSRWEAIVEGSSFSSGDRIG